MLIFTNQEPVVISIFLLSKSNERFAESWKELSDKILVLSMWHLRASSMDGWRQNPYRRTDHTRPQKTPASTIPEHVNNNNNNNNNIDSY